MASDIDAVLSTALERVNAADRAAQDAAVAEVATNGTWWAAGEIVRLRNLVRRAERAAERART